LALSGKGWRNLERFGAVWQRPQPDICIFFSGICSSVVRVLFACCSHVVREIAIFAKKARRWVKENWDKKLLLFRKRNNTKCLRAL